MKKILCMMAITASLWNLTAYGQTKPTNQVQVTIDLNTIKDDRVTVTVTPPNISASEIIYHFPKILFKIELHNFN